MALPVSGVTVAEAYAALRDKTINLKSYCVQVQNSTTISCTSLRGMLGAAMNLAAYATGLSTQTGFTAALTSYVQQMVGDATLNVAADFSVSLTYLDALITAIIADLPKDGAGHLLDTTITSAGVISTVSLTPTQLPKTLPAIASWLATIA